MTKKFRNVKSELGRILEKTRTVKTREQARKLSLRKWKAIQMMAAMFFNEIGVRCGFCGYGERKAGEKGEKVGHYIGRCTVCGVRTICDPMLVKVQGLKEETLELIDGLITHFENMKVAVA